MLPHSRLVLFSGLLLVVALLLVIIQASTPKDIEPQADAPVQATTAAVSAQAVEDPSPAAASQPPPVSTAPACSEALQQPVADLLATIDRQGPFEPTSVAEGEAQLNAAHHYLSLLDEATLEALANQGYRDAMTVYGVQLLDSTASAQQQRGRELLYQAGVLGSAYALSRLSVSYYGEYLQHLEAEQVQPAALAYQQFHNSQHLVAQLAPVPTEVDLAFEDALLNTALVPLASMEAEQAQSLLAFNQQRLVQGLPTVGDKGEATDLSQQARAISAQLRACVAAASG